MTPETHERLTAYIDGEMSEADAERFEEEMQRDPMLRKSWEEFRLIRDYMMRVAEEQAPRTMYQRIMDTIDVDAAARRREAPSMAWPLTLIALAVAVLFFMVGVQPPKHTGAAATSPEGMEQIQAAAAAAAPAAPPINAPANPPQGGVSHPTIHPYPMAPASYRLWGPNSFAALQAVAQEVGGRLVDAQGQPVTEPTTEVWIELTADHMTQLRQGLDRRVRVESIGMPRLIEGTFRQRILLSEP